MPPREITPMERAMRLLAMRAHSEKELAAKLRKYEYPFPVIRETVENCRRHGFLNDELLAKDGTRSLSERGCGARRIRQKLQQRGVPHALIAEALEENRENESGAALRALEYKLRLLQHETDPRKKREKAFRFLAGRGFSIDVIRAALEHFSL